MGLLDGLLGGGDDLYGDLLTEKQRQALTGRGLLAMAGAFADAAAPSRLPVPLGAAFGKAAQALGQGRDDAANTALKAMYYGEQARKLKTDAELSQQLMADLKSLPLDELYRRYGGGQAPAPSPAGPGAPAPAAPPGAGAPAPPGGPPPPMGGPLALPPMPDTSLPGPLAAPTGDPALGVTAPALGYGYGAGGALTKRPTLPPGSGASLAPGGLLGPATGGPDEVLTADTGLLAKPASFGGGAPPVQQAAATGRDPLDIIEQFESGGRNVMQGVVPPGGGYNPSVGRVTGPSTAQGPWQITDTTWKETAPKVGIDTTKYPNAMSVPVEVQKVVAQKLYDEQGYAPWAPYNKALAKAVGWTGGSGEDTVVGQGRGAPGFTRAQYTPGGGAPAAPGAVPPGAAGAQNMQPLLLELARRNAAAEILGKGTPYQSLLGVLQGSPAYKAAVERATQEVQSEFVGPNARSKAEAERPFQLEQIDRRATLELQTKLAEKGFQLDKEGNLVDIPNHRALVGKTEQELQDIKSDAAKQVEAHKQKYQFSDVTIQGPDGPETRSVSAAERERLERETAKRRSMSPNSYTPREGDIVSTPAYSTSETKLRDALNDSYIKLRATAEAAPDQIRDTHELRRLIDAGMFTGVGSDKELFVARMVDKLGLAGQTTQEKIASTQLYTINLAREVASTLQAMKLSPVGVSDLEYVKGIAGNPELTESALRRLLDIREKYARQAIERHNEQAKGKSERVFKDTGSPRFLPLPPAYERAQTGGQPAPGSTGGPIIRDVDPNTGRLR